MEQVMEYRAAFTPKPKAAPEKRHFKKLRLSITPDCNLGCLYCDQDRKKNGSAKMHHAKIPDLVSMVSKLHKALDLTSIQITGGEPTLCDNLPDLITALKKTGNFQINLTTNGILLRQMAGRLKEAGLDRINLSLDAIEPGLYKKITGGDYFYKVMASLKEAQAQKIPVKINSVIMRGINDRQILPLLDFAIKENIVIRFLELMKMGVFSEQHQKHHKYVFPRFFSRFFSQEEILSVVSSKYGIESKVRPKSSTANYYLTERGGVKYAFGIIANHSEPFCNDCDRLRMDHNGNIYGCLSNPVNFSLKGIPEHEYPKLLQDALALKQTSRFTGSGLVMRKIGG